MSILELLDFSNIDFTENLSNRIILKFPQRDLCSALEIVKSVIYKV